MQNDKISVVIPVYKAEKYIDRCVDSIVNQTYKNLEIILVDDGSPDNSGQLCDEWAKKDSRVKVIHQPNAGDANARNRAFDIMSGDYFIFIDNDDWADADMLEFLHKLITENDADMARCGFYTFVEDTGREETDFSADSPVVMMDKNEQLADLFVSGHISGVLWNKLYKTSSLGDVRLDQAEGCSDDFMFNYRVIKKDIKSVCKDEPKYHYVLRAGSMTKSEFTDTALTIVWAKQGVMEQEMGNNAAAPYLIKGYIISCYAILNGIIKHQKCLNRYDYLRSEILKYKKEILLTNRYSLHDKMKTLLLLLAKPVYNKLVQTA